MPIYEPATFLVVGLFSKPSVKRFTSASRNPPQLLAKMRLRLSTITPNTAHDCELPMLAPRSEDGGHFCTAHMRITVCPLRSGFHR